MGATLIHRSWRINLTILAILLVAMALVLYRQRDQFSGQPSTSEAATELPPLLATVMAITPPQIAHELLSPNGQQRAEVVSYACTALREVGEVRYEELRLIDVATEKQRSVATQQINCGGLGGQAASSSVIPVHDGKLSFTPTRAMTLLVAFGLLSAALVVLGTLGYWRLGLPMWLFKAGSWALAALFLMRAIGDFHWVGFFKSVHNTPFARNDSRFYSPLCVAIAAACAILGTYA